MKRIYITGAIGSGKTYAARLLGEALRLPHHGLDPIVFDLEAKAYRQRFPETVRDEKLRILVEGDSWIIEGWYRGDWLIPMYQRADLVLLLDTPLRLRNWRIISRFARRKLGLIPDPVPLGGLKHLGRLLRWTRLFEGEAMRAEVARHVRQDCRIVVVHKKLTPGIWEECIHETGLR
jgi:hypothetical protein